MSFFDWLTQSDLKPINRKLDLIGQRQGVIMADLTTLKAAADQLTTDVGEAVTALNALAAQVAEGGSVSQEDIDAITTTLTSSSTALDEAVDATDGQDDEPVEEPPA